MGVNDGAKVLHSITDLSLSDVAAMCRGIAVERGVDKPRVVADCNNIVYVFSKSSSIILSVANHLMKWASTGIVMVPVCDGIRPVCKQATNQRIAASEKNRIKSFVLRKQIREAKERLIREKFNQGKRTALSKEISKMQRGCKSCETKSTVKIPNDYAVGLKDELFNCGGHTAIPSTGGYVEEVVVSTFQADSHMAKQIIDNKAVMAMTTDSDIPIICGDCCIAIKSFTKGAFTVVSVSERTLKQAMKHIATDSKAKFVQAENPVFDGVKNHRLRALMMIVLGCDVYKSGMTGVLSSKLKEMIALARATSEDNLYLNIRDSFKYKNKLTEEVIETYVNVLFINLTVTG